MADPDPWRNQLREVLQASSSQVRLTSLGDLAKSARIDELPAMSLSLLGGTLLLLGDPAGAEAVLRQGQRRHTGDVWINYILAECLERLARREEAIRYYIAAKSLRPETAHSLAHALTQKGETDEAIAVFEDLVRLRPKDGRHLACLGIALKSRGRTEEAKRVLNSATSALRASVLLKPDLPNAHFELGFALHEQGKLDEAIVEYQLAALRLKPEYAKAHGNLGRVLDEPGKA